MTPQFFYDGDYREKIRVGPIRFIQPFTGKGDESIYIIEEDYQQFNASYVPTPLNEEHPEYPGFYCVADGVNPQFPGNNLRQATRVYAAIPLDRTDGSSIGWTIPGLSRGGTNTVYQLDPVPDPVDGKIEFTTKEDNDFLVGDKVFFYYQIPRSVYKPEETLPATIVDINSSKKFTIYVNGAPIGGSFQSIFYVQKAAPGREPRTKAVPCNVIFDYWLVDPDLPLNLPAHIVNTVAQIPIETTPQVINAFQQLVDPPTYSGETIPDNGTYNAQVAAGAQIVAQDSALDRWQGNIYERVTRYVTAQ